MTDVQPIPPREGQTFDGTGMLARWSSFVKLPHTLFALPFALVGMLAASRVASLRMGSILGIVVAFSAARFAAMGFNRIVDREFDRANPRTAGRELPRGTISVAAARSAVLVSSLLFVVASWTLNPLSFFLSPLALLWVLSYSYSKRFTTWPHLWLGMSLAMAPVGGWIAVTGEWSDPWWALLLVAFGVLTWVAGFDIFYALPDAAFDRANNLRSVVVRFGVPRAILIAKLLHGFTLPALAVFGWATGFGWWYAAGLVVAALLLAWEHHLVRPDDLTRLDAAFFTMNGVMSVTVFAFALLDRILTP